MAHDVFISYSSGDKPVADAVCAALEQQAVRCWMAPRDVLPGDEWSAAIVAALKQSKLLVVVFSSRTNASRQVVREVELAVRLGQPVLPLRIEQVELAGSFEYFLGVPHWLDAITPPLEQHLERLVESVGRLLDRPVITSTAPITTTARSPQSDQADAVTDVSIDDWGRRRRPGVLRRLLEDR